MSAVTVDASRAPCPHHLGQQAVLDTLSTQLSYASVKSTLTGRVLDVHVEEGQAVVEVGDDGPGIPPELLERIFEPFRGTDEQSQPASLGLGLTISRQLAELMNGSLTYEHKEGLSTFTLRLPRTPNGHLTETGE